MHKIPTVFVRDRDDRKHVTSEVTPGCEWVLAGEGVATRKYDGTCCMFDGEQWWARREVKPGKLPPRNFVTISHDDITGKTVGWEPIGQSGFAKWHADALAMHFDPAEAWDVGTYELCGPKINGNPEGFPAHTLIQHARATKLDVGANADDVHLAVRDYAAIGWEGIVWHHPDGRMAKLKARDLPSLS